MRDVALAHDHNLRWRPGRTPYATALPTPGSGQSARRTDAGAGHRSHRRPARLSPWRSARTLVGGISQMAPGPHHDRPGRAFVARRGRTEGTGARRGDAAPGRIG